MTKKEIEKRAQKISTLWRKHNLTPAKFGFAGCRACIVSVLGVENGRTSGVDNYIKSKRRIKGAQEMEDGFMGRTVLAGNSTVRRERSAYYKIGARVAELVNPV